MENAEVQVTVRPMDASKALYPLIVNITLRVHLVIIVHRCLTLVLEGYML